MTVVVVLDTRTVPSSSELKSSPLSMCMEAPESTTDSLSCLPEDGHAMMQCDTFHSFRNLSHAVRGCDKTIHKCAQTSRLTCTCYKKPVEKWQVDCEAMFRSVVGSCTLSGCQKVLSAGSWARPTCVVSSLLVESWMVQKDTNRTKCEETMALF